MADAPHSKFRYGHLIAAACFSIQAIGIGTYIAFGVFFNPLMAEFGWSRALISGASSAAFFLMGLFGMVVGRLNDRIGPRQLMTVTAVFLGVGHMLMARIETVWQLYLFYGLIFGIGLSSIDVIALTTIARWFEHKRGMMTGIVKVGTGAGQFTLPLLASVLIAAYGWRLAYVALGAGALLLLVGIAQVLRRDPGPQFSTPAPGATQTALPPRWAAASLTLDQAAHTLQLWTLCLVNLTVVFCLMSILVHIVPHARDIGVSPARSAGVLSTIGGVSMVGRFLTGMSIDRIGSKRAMVVCFGMLIAGLLWLQVAANTWMLYLFAGVYGLAHGGFFTAISPIVAEFFGIGSHGALFGLVAFFGTAGGAFGPILAGYVYDVTGSYALYFWLITALTAVALGLILSLKPIPRPPAER